VFLYPPRSQRLSILAFTRLFFLLTRKMLLDEELLGKSDLVGAVKKQLSAYQTSIWSPTSK
jgi:hypothetical protein